MRKSTRAKINRAIAELEKAGHKAEYKPGDEQTDGQIVLADDDKATIQVCLADVYDAEDDAFVPNYVPGDGSGFVFGHEWVSPAKAVGELIEFMGKYGPKKEIAK